MLASGERRLIVGSSRRHLGTHSGFGIDGFLGAARPRPRLVELIVGLGHPLLMEGDQGLDRTFHYCMEIGRILLARKVQAVNLLLIPPLVESRCCRVIFQGPTDRAIDDHRVVGWALSTHHSKRVRLSRVVDMDAGRIRLATGRNPFLVRLIVHHYRGLGRYERLLSLRPSIIVHEKSRTCVTLMEVIHSTRNKKLITHIACDTTKK